MKAGTRLKAFLALYSGRDQDGSDRLAKLPSLHCCEDSQADLKRGRLDAIQWRKVFDLGPGAAIDAQATEALGACESLAKWTAANQSLP